MKVYRFGEDGFTPTRQHIWIAMLEYYLDTNNMSNYEKAEQYVYELDYCLANRDKLRKFALNRWDDWQYGTWVFGEKLFHDDERQRYLNGQLNHLTSLDKEKRNWYEAEIPDDVLAYDAHIDMIILNPICLKENAFYIPDKKCCFKNIRQITRSLI